MRRVLLIVLACGCVGAALRAHGGAGSVTWNREISRIVYDKCASCHRPGGTAFSLMTYADVQPRGTAIKDAVLARRMPPWGAVKGFGQFRNDQSLSQEQIELITKWVDAGIRRGNNPGMLPPAPAFAPATPSAPPAKVIRVNGRFVLNHPLALDGLIPEQVSGQSMQIIAAMPGGHMEPLLWLHGYDPRASHAFLLRRTISLPAGTVIQGVSAGSVIGLIPH